MYKLIASMVTALLTTLLAATALADGDMVKLIRAQNYYVSGYHNGGYLEQNVLIQVKNVAYSKQVVVHAERSDGAWIDVPAHFLRMGDATYELWSANREDFGPHTYNRYALKYVVNGETYWDNNNGADYVFQAGSSTGPGPRLGNDVNVLLLSASLSGGYLYAYIDVRNIAYAKDLELIYTTDNWASSTVLDASFYEWYQTGYSSFIRSPNAYGIERWRVYAPLGASSLKFYISYSVGGSVYYDNNYGANYSIG